VIKNELKAGLVLHTRQLKEDNERTKTTLSGTESVKVVRLNSSVAVRWVGEDLWWEGFVEQVSFESRMEERGSDGWPRWWCR